jgi:protein-disulfide isomerase
MIISGSVVGVIAVAAAIGIGVQASQHNLPYAAPVGAVADTVSKNKSDSLGVLFGSQDAPVKMSVYEDFRCPVCQATEAAIESTYKQYVTAGKLQITYHPVRLIDGNSGGVGSRNGGNAAACAQDAGQFIALHDVLYANQPAETTDGYGSKATILSLANQIPALKGNASFTDCVNKGAHDGWVQKNHDDFAALKLAGTPSFFLQGAAFSFSTTGITSQSQVAPAEVQQLKTALDAAFTKAGGKAGTPFTIPTAAPSGATTPAPSTPAPSGGTSAPTTPTTPAASPSSGGSSSPSSKSSSSPSASTTTS